MSDVSKIPCTIVTGFLGAGKTTLVRHLLENAGGRRIAVLVNEFGDLGFDGSFIEGCGIEGCTKEDIVELPNGCLCCTVADDAVIAVVDGPAVASGAFAEDPEALEAQRRADSSVDHENPLEEVFEDQLLCA